MFDALFQDAALLQAVGTIVAVVAMFFFRKIAGSFVSAKDMAALHEAIKSAAVDALSGNPNMALAELREVVAQHLVKSVPDAMKKLMPDLLKRVGVSKTTGTFVTNEVLDPILTTIVSRYRAEALSGLGFPIEQKS